MISNPLRAGVYVGFSNPGVVAALLGKDVLNEIAVVKKAGALPHPADVKYI
jgi:hypothetical protein